MPARDPSEIKKARASRRWLALGGLCGVVAPPLTLSLVLYGVAISPWFDWQRDALSDIGVSENALIFNGALAMDSLLSILFALGLAVWLGRGWLARGGVAALIVGALGIGAISVITEDYGRPHFWLAATYFVATPLAYLLLAPAMFRERRGVMGALSIAAGAAAILLILFVPHDGFAVPELAASLILSAWTFSLGVELLSRAYRTGA